MSSSSGIPASPELLSAFADAVQSQSVRFIKVLIQNESLVNEQSAPLSKSFEEDLEILRGEDFLSHDSAAYILAKLDSPSQDWITIFYVPDTANVREKMLYASTRSSLLRSLGSSLFTDSIFATSKADLTPDAYSAHLKHVAAPHPLSSREQELADLRLAENKAAAYQGSGAQATHIGTGVGLKWSTDVENALIELARGSENALLVITVDPKTESLVLHSTSTIDVDSVGATLPANEPCYAWIAWSHSINSSLTREITFIYSCPSNSPIKHRMIYSSGSTSTYQTAKSLLAESSPATTISARKVETSNPQEINEALLITELGYSASEQSVDTEIKRFAKPKGPPRRRQ